ncbi:MAG: prenyltransferase [Pseudomonadales bacterium]|nr:prenyltransferase [Pseudomonadales bacterium]
MNTTRIPAAPPATATETGTALSVARALVDVPRLTAADWTATGLLARWLVAVRAPVLIMTFSSAAAGGLLALRDAAQGAVPAFDTGAWLLCTLGLLLAHATNNLLNDLTDSRRGIDEDNYFRNRYGTHVIEQGLLDGPGFWAYLLATGGVALAIGIHLVLATGPQVLLPLVPGAVCLLFYTWPFKQWGLGEIAVLLVWGPLMVAGTYLVSTGIWSAGALWAGLLAGLGPTVVIFGKHIDKLELDAAKGVRTLPVRLGEARARAVLRITALTQYPLCLALILAGVLPWTTALVLLSLSSAWALVAQARAPRPDTRPADWPEAVWPLWFVAAGFAHARLFGPLLLLGLAVGWMMGV